jgi:quinol monooxygenase YgiN
MSVVRHYIMVAAEGKASALEQALRVLLDHVRALPGSEGVELLRDQADSARFVFLERWASVEAHSQAGKQLSKAVMAPVMEALAGRPDGAYLDPIRTV